jgi:hypothetical protein
VRIDHFHGSYRDRRFNPETEDGPFQTPSAGRVLNNSKNIYLGAYVVGISPVPNA